MLVIHCSLWVGLGLVAMDDEISKHTSRDAEISKNELTSWTMVSLCSETPQVLDPT